mmetsp:Transcript_24138/g.45133  ORF Transcript_24138/g.45133 Transcript_24138/m.45133 type:complete len:307 (-) Transcript_24138:28-948(-)
MDKAFLEQYQAQYDQYQTQGGAQGAPILLGQQGGAREPKGPDIKTGGIIGSGLAGGQPDLQSIQMQQLAIEQYQQLMQQYALAAQIQQLQYGQIGQQLGGLVGTNQDYCCLHGKKRGMQNLTETHPGSGQWRCREDSVCKGTKDAKANLDLVTCSLHGKQRARDFMMITSDGKWKCKDGYECMGSSNVSSTPSTNGAYSGNKAPCMLHNKMRSMEALQACDNEGKQFVCKPGQRCKGVGTRPATSTAYSPYARTVGGAAGAGMMMAGGGGGRNFCIVHNKRRGARYLDPYPAIPGAFVCKPSEACK